MTVDFALFLSPDGLALAHRQPSGQWALVAEARPDGDAFQPAMSELRDAVGARGGANGQVLLVLPDDQVLYTSFMAPTDQTDLVEDRIREGLDGLTPYAVADLSYEWRAVEVDRVKVAVVAQETLDEAKQFAEGFGFDAIGFAAMPPFERYPGMPVFGKTDRGGLALPEDGLSFGPDEWTPPAKAAPEAPADDAGAGPEKAETAPARKAPAAGKDADAGKDSGNGKDAAAKKADEAQKDDTAKPDEAQDTASTPAPDAAPKDTADTPAKPATEKPTPDAKATKEASPALVPDPEAGAGGTEAKGLVPDPDAPEAAAQEAKGKASAKTEGEAPDAAPKAKAPAAEAKDTPKDGAKGAPSDPAQTASKPVPPNDTDETGDDTAPSDEDMQQPDLLAALVDPSLETPVAPNDAEDDTEAADDAPSARDEAPSAPASPAAPAKPEEAEASVSRRDAPKADARTQKAPAPAKSPEPAPEPSTTAPDSKGVGADTDADTDAETGDANEDPTPTFSAVRGKARAKTGMAAPSINERPSRLGFVAKTPSAEPILHPDAASKSDMPTPKAGPLAAQLARVRDASKARSTPAAPPAQTDPETSKPPQPAAPKPVVTAFDRAPTTPNQTKAKATIAKTSRLKGLFQRGGRATAATSGASAQAGAASAMDSVDSTFTSGLLARKPVESAGPSFKTGLILTLVLLVLLALIAVWSVLFLPNSPMARLFGGGTDTTEATLSDPFDAPAPPSVETVIPGIGARDPGAGGTVAEEATDTAPGTTGTEEVATLAPTVEVEEPATAPAPEPAPDAPADPPVEEVAAADALPPAELPDIDADLELPPLPPLPEELLPSLEETQRIYAEDGIWPRTPDRPSVAPFGNVDGVYIASIDPDVPGVDAIALPEAGVNPGEVLRRVPSPPPFGSDPTVDSRGLVEPTPEGALSPEGAFIIAGPPAVLSQPRPREVVPEIEAPEINVEDAILGTFRPSPRPINLEEIRERQVLGGLSVTELRDMRPPERPVSAQEEAQESADRASLFPRDQDTAGADIDAPTTTAEANPGTALAVASSRMPRLRPGNIADLVAAAQSAPAPEATITQVRATAAQPTIPSNASVSRAATERNAIRLRDVNLIGVTGTPSDRRALVRLPSGRFVRVAVGDRLDGGRVAAIGEDTLQYVRNGRNITLDIPG